MADLREMVQGLEQHFASITSDQVGREQSCEIQLNLGFFSGRTYRRCFSVCRKLRRRGYSTSS